MKLLKQGKNVALISQAGTPGISDPGAWLVQACLKQNFPVIPVPGPSAVTTALSISGFPCTPFLFLGFLSANKKKRVRLLQKSFSLGYTLVIFIPPHDLVNQLKEMADLAPERLATLCRELTKIHEEILRMPLRQLFFEIQSRGKVRGECTLVVGPEKHKNG